MNPTIDHTEFGKITIGGQVLDYDVVIRPDGQVEKRRKKLSKAIYGTSHVISLDEARHVWEEGVEHLLIGSGQFGLVELSDEAAGFFTSKNCQITLLPTPEAILAWNEAKGTVVGLFHITC